MAAEQLPVASVAAYVSTTLHPDIPPAWEASRALVIAAKACEPGAVHTVASLLAEHPLLAGFAGVVMSVPRSSGANVKCLALAEALVDAGIGRVMVDVLQRQRAVTSSRMLRRAGLQAVSCQEHAATIVASSPTRLQARVPILLVDDMFTEGNTMCGAVLALRKAGWKGRVLGATVGWLAEAPGHQRPIAPKTLYRAVS